MGATSELLKQHIGTIERWVSNLANDADFSWIKEQDGVHITDGVHVSYKDAVQLKPTTANIDFTKVDPEFLQQLIYHYAKIIRKYDAVMIEYADHLPDRRQDYDAARVEECLHPGGTVWRRTRYGIWELEVIKIEGNRLYFQDRNNPESCGSPFLSTLELFATREEAEDPNKEGYPYGKRVQEQGD